MKRLDSDEHGEYRKGRMGRVRTALEKYKQTDTPCMQSFLLGGASFGRRVAFGVRV